MKRVSVVMPVYNVEKYIKSAIQSVLDQTYQNLELIIVNDGSTDKSEEIYSQFTDSRIKIIKQQNRGLAGARNSGIRSSTGEYVAFLDSDDLWACDKLESHVQHLDNDDQIGVSYSHSKLINESGEPIGISQSSKVKNIELGDIICRNPIGNGSSPVIRKSLLEQTSFHSSIQGNSELSYFDESFRQSEDIEYWIRIALVSELKFEGIPRQLTLYRVNASGLSANLNNQFESWSRAMNKLALIAPKRISKFRSLAEAYQLRYLARRAVKNGNCKHAIRLALSAIRCNYRIIFREPAKTSITILASIGIWLIPRSILVR
ncbi:MAG: glycosyltransferase [Kangiellaceae bacterium]